jgi:hypothetical protein
LSARRGESVEEQWFTVVRVPLLLLSIGEQRLLYSVTGRVGWRCLVTYPSPDPTLVGRILELIHAKGEQRIELRDEAITYDYFTGSELPVEVGVFHAHYAFQFQWVRKSVPVRFIVYLVDKFWHKEREIKADATLEAYSEKAELVIEPAPSWVAGYDEEVTINGKTYRRIHGLFTSERTPFVDKDLEGQLEELCPSMPYLPVASSEVKGKRKRKRALPSSSGYNIDLLDLLKLIQRGLKVAPRPRAGCRALAASPAAPTPAIPTPRPGRE